MRQYSKSHLHIYSTHAVSKRESVTSSLGVKYKSNRGVLANGMCFSMVQWGSGNRVSIVPSLPKSLCVCAVDVKISVCLVKLSFQHRRGHCLSLFGLKDMPVKQFLKFLHAQVIL